VSSFVVKILSFFNIFFNFFLSRQSCQFGVQLMTARALESLHHPREREGGGVRGACTCPHRVARLERSRLERSSSSSSSSTVTGGREGEVYSHGGRLPAEWSRQKKRKRKKVVSGLLKAAVFQNHAWMKRPNIYLLSCCIQATSQHQQTPASFVLDKHTFNEAFCCSLYI